MDQKFNAFPEGVQPKYEWLNSNQKPEPKLIGEIEALARLCFPGMNTMQLNGLHSLVFPSRENVEPLREICLVRDPSTAELIGSCSFIGFTFSSNSLEREVHGLYVMDIMIRPDFQGQKLATQLLLSVINSRSPQPEVVISLATGVNSLHAFTKLSTHLPGYVAFPNTDQLIDPGLGRECLIAALSLLAGTPSAKHIVDVEIDLSSQIRLNHFHNPIYRDTEPWPADDELVQLVNSRSRIPSNTLTPYKTVAVFLFKQ